MQSETKRKIKVYVIAIIIHLAVGLLSALLTMDNMEIYSEVETPPLSPPSILFPIVWTVLYALMGVSSGMIWLRRNEDKRNSDIGLSLYAVSLAFNFVWSIIFFNFKMFLFSFIWLVVLWFLILGTIFYYAKLSKPAAYLQVPYAVWVAFAGYLNIGIWWLQR